MKWNLKNIIRKNFNPKALVLMYHRIAEPISDVWDISVSPSNFEQHLKILQKLKNVIPLQEITEDIKKKSLTNKSVSITFDDGYADNFLTAKPLLEKYKLPATFFIASANIGNTEEFWWDELESIFLFSEKLPSSFSMIIGDRLIESNIKDEENLNQSLKKEHSLWKAFEMPDPSLRSNLFLKVWEQLKPLAESDQKKLLNDIRNWATLTKSERPEYLSMRTHQLNVLGSIDLFHVGMHTVSHPALAFHNRHYQKNELIENRKFLQKVLGNEVSLLAYPYGNYNNETIEITKEIKTEAAFTTEKKLISNNSDLHSLGRFQVKNWDGKTFEKYLKTWFNS